MRNDKKKALTDALEGLPSCDDCKHISTCRLKEESFNELLLTGLVFPFKSALGKTAPFAFAAACEFYARRNGAVESSRSLCGADDPVTNRGSGRAG